MNRFQLREIRVDNYRCFDELRLPLEEDTTVLFAENGGGKTALLTALAMGLAVFQSDAPKVLKLDARRDPRMRTLDEQGRREPVGPCKVAWTADVGVSESVTWSTAAHPASGRKMNEHQPILEALERVRVPGDRWPLFAWYGVDRLRRLRGGRRKVERTRDRWEAYTSALDPNLDESSLLQWLQDEMLGDVVRRQQYEPERLFHAAVMEATARATPGVTHGWYDPAAEGPVVRFEGRARRPVVRAVRRLSRVHRAGRRHRPPRRHAQRDRRRRRTRTGGGRSAHRRARPPSAPALATGGASEASRRIPEVAAHHHHALTAGTEQRREPPSSPARRREASRASGIRGGQGHERDPSRSHAHG